MANISAPPHSSNAPRDGEPWCQLLCDPSAESPHPPPTAPLYLLRCCNHYVCRNCLTADLFYAPPDNDIIACAFFKCERTLAIVLRDPVEELVLNSKAYEKAEEYRKDTENVVNPIIVLNNEAEVFMRKLWNRMAQLNAPGLEDLGGGDPMANSCFAAIKTWFGEQVVYEDITPGRFLLSPLEILKELQEVVDKHLFDYALEVAPELIAVGRNHDEEAVAQKEMLKAAMKDYTQVEWMDRVWTDFIEALQVLLLWRHLEWFEAIKHLEVPRD
ncbi:hypothetical protein BU26DRAFT_348780 [Trematosphaeria pertusa]|uniref:RING-type domain-containing protein n=1 Tax=Trematosphaeria pertusa TaxID=390896 RepID=A0A6A6IAB7_9PLEO|nr:uncharacterized protein BU26DRAFT_348780 [Trematosphaeria pertusa]KAF2247505.1 hypothetical protein BU26DRAFT_348780 [Trematosphaeria pertusa]